MRPLYPVYVENFSFQHRQKEKTEAGLRPATLYKSHWFYSKRGVSPFLGEDNLFLFGAAFTARYVTALFANFCQQTRTHLF